MNQNDAMIRQTVKKILECLDELIIQYELLKVDLLPMDKFLEMFEQQMKIIKECRDKLKAD